MGKFIEEFYYGNIDPQARSTKQNKAVQKQMEWVGCMNNIRGRATELVNRNNIHLTNNGSLLLRSEPLL